jgi:transposase, IS30 family
MWLRDDVRRGWQLSSPRGRVTSLRRPRGLPPGVSTHPLRSTLPKPRPSATTRFTLLVRLPENRKAVTVRDAVAAKIVELPVQLRRSLTWDQGKEMAAHVSFSVATDVAVDFCDPHSPWQRGTNENANGLLRRYLPRSLDFGTDAQLDAIATELNERPRETLGWMTPSEKFSELAATAA